MTPITFWDLKLGTRFIAKGNAKTIWTVKEITGKKIRICNGETWAVKDFKALQACIELVVGNKLL